MEGVWIIRLFRKNQNTNGFDNNESMLLGIDVLTCRISLKQINITMHLSSHMICV